MVLNFCIIFGLGFHLDHKALEYSIFISSNYSETSVVFYFSDNNEKTLNKNFPIQHLIISTWLARLVLFCHCCRDLVVVQNIIWLLSVCVL